MTDQRTCPRCGGRLVRRSGFVMCRECDHRMGTQDPSQDWGAYDPELGRQRARGSDAQTRPDLSSHRGPRLELDFERRPRRGD